MATETELERMVVRLIGDSESYHKMIQDSIALTDRGVAQINQSIGTLGSGSVAIGTMSAHVIEGMSRSIISFARDAASSYGRYEEAEIRMKSILTSNKRNVEDLYASYSRFAKELRFSTNVSTVATLNMLQLAEAMGVTGTQAERAVKNAVALGAIRGMDPQSFIRMTVALEQGSTQMMTRYLPALRLIKNESERTAKAQQLLGNMFQTAENLANSHTGQIDRLYGSIGKLKTEFGRLTAEAFQPVIQAAQRFVDWLNSLSDGAKVTMFSIGALVGAAGALIPVFSTFFQGWAAVKELFVSTPAQISATTAALAENVAAVQAEAVAQAELATVLLQTTTAETELATASIAASGNRIKSNVAEQASINSLHLTRKAFDYGLEIRAGEAIVANQLQAVISTDSLTTAVMANTEAWMANTATVNMASGAITAEELAARKSYASMTLSTEAIAAQNMYCQQLTMSQAEVAAATTATTTSVSRLSAASVIARGSIYALGAYAVYKLTMWLAGGNAALEQFNQSMEQSAKLRTALGKTGVAETSGLITAEQVDAARKQLGSYQDAVRIARKEVESTGTYNPMYWLIGNKDLELAKDKLKDAEAAAERAKVKFDQLGKSYKEVAAGRISAEGYKDIQTLTEKLRIQNAVYEEQSEYLREIKTLIESMPKEQRSTADSLLAGARYYAASLESKEKAKGIDDLIKKAEKAKSIVNLTEGQIEAVEARRLGASAETQRWLLSTYSWIDGQKKAKEAEEELVNSIDALNKSLQERVATFKMTSTEAEIYKLQMKGATDKELEYARSMVPKLQILEDNKKLIEKGKEVTEKYITPLDKLIQTKADLSEMLNAGAITLDTYTKALQDAEQQAHKDYTVQFKTSGVDALLAGTKEMQQALYDYQLGKTPIPRPVEKPQVLAKERTFEWSGRDTSTLLGPNKAVETLLASEGGKKSEVLLGKLVELAQAYWTGESLIIKPLGL